MRTPLPPRRHAETFDVRFANLDFRVTIGYFGDHTTPGEVFVTAHKAGSNLEATARDGAILLSLAIQHGVPLDTIVSALTREGDGSPSTVVGAVADKLAADHGAISEPRPVEVRFPKLVAEVRKALEGA